MAKLLNMLITLPVVILPVAALAAKPAMAEMISPSQALEYMAKSQAASAKCGILTRSEQTELKQYAARAEVAAVQRLGKEATQNTVSSGKAEGKAVSCTGATAAEVYEVLEAARTAVAQADGGRRARPSLLPQARSVRLPGSSQAVRIERDEPPPRGSLGRFQRVAKAYFIEKRCRFLAYSKAQNFWQEVVGSQAEAMASNGRKSVNSTLKQARLSAQSVPCDAKTARLVRSVYATLASN